MHPDCDRIIIDQDHIEARIKELGKQITDDYKGCKSIICIALLKGAVTFAVDLTRAIWRNVQLDYMDVSSYGDGMTSSGNIVITKDIETDIEGKDVLIIEDIIDTGRTMAKVVELLKERNPKSLKVASFLLKEDAREVECQCDYYGFPCPNEFMVGYGLDFAQNYRCLPYVAVLKPEVYE